MELPFLDRRQELSRLQAMLGRPHGALAVLYGRRRCGKSRLLFEALAGRPAVYFVADEREATLHRQALAIEIEQLVPGFGEVTYPDWDALLGRWWREAPAGSILALDEFQAMAAASIELPSLLQKWIDRQKAGGKHTVLCGSSQRMMQGLVLDRSAALFGRASEIMRIEPLPPGWIRRALGIEDAIAAIEAYALWGGVPRYWELAADFTSRDEAMRSLVLDPLGVLFREPDALLLDDVRDPAQSASILQLIGQGCHRLSEIAGRLGKPATSLVRPLQRLLELGLVARDRPFATHERDGKRSLYRLKDPFLRFWFRFVAPHRSRLEARAIESVARGVADEYPRFVAQCWEDLARQSVPRSRLHGIDWNPAASWWGNGIDRRPLEVDVVAESVDGSSILLGSVKWEQKTDMGRVTNELLEAAVRLPFIHGRSVVPVIWSRQKGQRGARGVVVVGPHEVLEMLT